MAATLTDLGEEWLLKTNADSATLDVGLYNDSTDSIGETNDLTNITTEPSGGSYARQSTAFSARDVGGDWQLDNDAQITFDTSDSSQTVDSYFIVANFQATDTGDGSPQDHLIATGSLSQSYDLSSVDTLNINANTAGFSLT